MRILPIIVKKFTSVKDRLDHCKVLGLCMLCTDPSHVDANCLGKKKKASSDLAGIARAAAMSVLCVPVGIGLL